MTYILLLAGLAGLFFGGDILVRGGVGIARRFGLSPLVIGLTVIGFGTSMPELLVSVQAALGGTPAIALGNVVGSNTANLLLILGASAVIAPFAIRFSEVRRDLWVMLAATATLWIFLLDGRISRPEAGILVIALVVYLVQALRSGQVEVPQEQDADTVPPRLAPAALMALGGLVLLMVSAKALIWSATDIARAFGLSEAVIGLTVVAIGTSLPELATAAAAAMRRQSDIALGNVLGSNIFNILAILGITALISPLPADARFALTDLPVLAVVSCLVFLICWRPGRIGRLPAGGLLVGYAAYLAAMGGA